MDWFTKQNAKRVLNAVIVTLAIAATFHLTLVSIMAVYQRTMAYLNPLDFLGVSILLPEYRDSRIAAGIGWLILIMLFGAVLLVRARYHVYITIIKDSRVGTRVLNTSYKVRDIFNTKSVKPPKTTKKQK